MDSPSLFCLRSLRLLARCGSLLLWVYLFRYTGTELASFCRSPITPMTSLSCSGDAQAQSCFMTSYFRPSRRDLQNENFHPNLDNRNRTFPFSSPSSKSRSPSTTTRRGLRTSEIFTKDDASKAIYDSILFLPTVCLKEEWTINGSFLSDCTLYTPQYSLPACKKCSLIKINHQ